MANTNQLSILLLFTMSITLGCGSSHDIKQAELYPATFHRHFNNGEAILIYQDADPSFKQGLTQEAFLTVFSGIKDKLGSFVSESCPSWQIGAFAGGRETVLLQCSAIYSKGPAAETFVFVQTASGLKLQRYLITSQLLLGTDSVGSRSSPRS